MPTRNILPCYDNEGAVGNSSKTLAEGRFYDLYCKGTPWIDVRIYGETTGFALAVAAIGSTSSVLYIPNEQSVTGDVTVPATLTLKFSPGGFLNIATTKTVTINGNIEAGLTKIFSCTGTGKVVFGAGAVKEVYPEWWGIDGTADEVQINAAYLSLPLAGGTVRLLSRDYSIADSILPTIGSTFKGQFSGWASDTTGSSFGSRIIWAGAASGIMLKVFNVHHFKFTGIILEGAETTGVIGILLDGTNNPAGKLNIFEEFAVSNCHTGIQWGTSPTNDYQLDTTSIRYFAIKSTVAMSAAGSKGIVINSANTQLSEIRNGGIQLVDIGIDVQEGLAFSTIDKLGFGSLTGTAIRLSSVADLTISNCESEAATKFIEIIGSPNSEGAINLFYNVFNDPVSIDRTCRITSIGNYGPSTGTVTENAMIVSINDRFNAAAGWNVSAAGHLMVLGSGDTGADIPGIRMKDGTVGIGTMAPKSALHVVGLPVYANNAAAVAGGLTAGAFYRTGGDPDPTCVVH